MTIDEFEKYIKQLLKFDISITYHPRKPLSYLNKSSVIQCCGNHKRF